jgi:hypothetical protein
VPTWNGKWPMRYLLTIALCSVQCATGQSGAHRDREGWELPNEAPTTPRFLGAIKGPLGAMEQYPGILCAHLNSEPQRPRCWFVRERFEHIFELWPCRFDLCALSFTCVCVVAALCFLCVCTLLLTPDLIVIICVRRERLQFWRFLTTGY